LAVQQVVVADAGECVSMLCTVTALLLLVSCWGTGLSDDHKNKIMDTVIALNIFLDVPKPWTWVLHDPSGTSEFKPMEGVLVEQDVQDQDQQQAGRAAAAAADSSDDGAAAAAADDDGVAAAAAEHFDRCG